MAEKRIEVAGRVYVYDDEWTHWERQAEGLPTVVTAEEEEYLDALYEAQQHIKELERHLTSAEKRCKAFSENADIHRARANRYRDRLAELAENVQAAIARLMGGERQ